MNSPQTLLAFDFGMKYIGVAVGQTLTKSARPLTSIKAAQGKPSWTELEKLIKEWQPNALVVGIPYNMDGTNQPMTGFARQFANQLRNKFNLTVHEVDERLTTKSAREEIFASAGYRGLKKSAVDALSAKIILESFFSL